MGLNHITAEHTDEKKKIVEQARAIFEEKN